MATQTASRSTKTAAAKGSAAPKGSSAPKNDASNGTGSAPRQYDNNMRGALFSNKRKQEGSKQPDYTGSIEINGVPFYLSGWKQKAKQGDLAGQSYFSLAIQSKEKGEGKVEKANDDDLRGVLFGNSRKQDGGKQPDYTGRLTVGGKLFYLSAWVQESGEQQKYFSLAVRDAEEAKKAGEAEPAAAPAPAETSTADGDDDLPF